MSDSPTFQKPPTTENLLEELKELWGETVFQELMKSPVDKPIYVKNGQVIMSGAPKVKT